MTTNIYKDCYEHKLTIQLLAEVRLNGSLIYNSYTTCRHRTIKNNSENGENIYKKLLPAIFDSTREIKVLISRALPCCHARILTAGFDTPKRKGKKRRKIVLGKFPKTKDNDFFAEMLRTRTKTEKPHITVHQYEIYLQMTWSSRNSHGIYPTKILKLINKFSKVAGYIM